MSFRDVVQAEGGVIEQLIDSTYFPIGCVETIRFEYENEIIDKTDVNSGGFRKKRVRMSDTRISLSGVTKLTNQGNVLGIFESLTNAYSRSENTYRITATAQDLSVATIVVTGVISRIDIGFSATDFSDFDMEIEGSGGIEFEDPANPGSGTQIDSDTWTIAGGLAYISDARLVGVADIIEVCLEGLQYDETTGAPSGRQFLYTSATGRITFDSSIVIDGQKVFVVWLY